MIKQITQYNNIDYKGTIFQPGKGWDGTYGPWVFHTIDTLEKRSYKWMQGKQTCSIEEWTEEAKHLNNFRLEFIYD